MSCHAIPTGDGSAARKRGVEIVSVEPEPRLLDPAAQRHICRLTR